MFGFRRCPALPIAALLVILLVRGASGDESAPPSFNTDVRPILAAKCFACHGPDEDSREAGLRLDTFEGASEDLGGYQAIAAGDAEASELILRVSSDDPDMLMPPPEGGQPLTEEEIEILRRWIDAGGDYDEHWSFTPPRRPPVPEVSRREWAANAIDAFVLHRLEAEGLSPSAEADRLTLVRRVYFDLIGLPPTPEQADAFLRDTRPDAYSRLVDRLLSSEQYGERWARVWLDVARYADTNGYEKDRPRSIWPYRDWVIRAMNQDMPFDQFSIAQLAGDMLPDASADERIATGFHRNTMLNEEGGIDPLEYRFYAMVDRVATTGLVWMGLTTGCAQCHSHKYDPISHTDYYRLMALLNNADEPDMVVPAPQIQQQRDAMLEKIASLEAALADQFPLAEAPQPAAESVATAEPSAAAEPASEAERRAASLAAALETWIADQRSRAKPWSVLRPERMKTNLPRLELRDDGSIFSSGDITKRDVFELSIPLDSIQSPNGSPLAGPITALRLEVLPDDSLPAGGPGRGYYEGRRGDFFLSEVTARVGETPLKFASASHSYGKISVGSGSADAGNVIDGNGSTGWSTAEREGESHQLVLRLSEPLPISAIEPTGPNPQPRELHLTMLFERHFAASLGRFRWSATDASGEVVASDLPTELEAQLAAAGTNWTPEVREQLRRQFLRTTPELAEARKPIEQLRKQLPKLPTTLVMSERPADNPRPTYLHHRGEYLSPREEVEPGVPEIFPPLAEGEPANRLGLARWLVSDRNPLVARVTVNRSWQAIFGSGLVPGSGDFGTQTPPPIHQELLDFLAIELVESGWSLKNLHRKIVTSRTYRQQSKADEELWRRDPENRLLARGPRHRLNAEMIRDAALVASGLFQSEIGGPSVYPPQPPSVTALAYGNTPWPTSEGGDRYRRSLYTFAKRTAPFAAYATFDAPTGENCMVVRDRSNTPLQALTQLNDAMFLEFSQALAQQATEAAEAPAEQLEWIFRRCLTRSPTAAESDAILAFRDQQLKRLRAEELDPRAIAGLPLEEPSTAEKAAETAPAETAPADGGPAETAPAEELPSASAELASWAMVARVVMNLDEMITNQ